MAGKFDRFWEMHQGGPYDEKGVEIFKCTDCGAVTAPEQGHNGEPDPSHCNARCRANHGAWKPGGVTDLYRQKYLATFPDSPGADI